MTSVSSLVALPSTPPPLISKERFTVVIHYSRIIFWSDFVFRKDSLVLCQDPVRYIFGIDMKLMDYISTFVSNICSPLSHLPPVYYDILVKVGELVLRQHWYIFPGDIVITWSSPIFQKKWARFSWVL